MRRFGDRNNHLRENRWIRGVLCLWCFSINNNSEGDVGSRDRHGNRIFAHENFTTSSDRCLEWSELVRIVSEHSIESETLDV